MAMNITGAIRSNIRLRKCPSQRIPRTCYELAYFPIYERGDRCLGDKPTHSSGQRLVPSGNVARTRHRQHQPPAPGVVVTPEQSRWTHVTATDDVHVEA